MVANTIKADGTGNLIVRKTTGGTVIIWEKDYFVSKGICVMNAMNGG